MKESIAKIFAESIKKPDQVDATGSGADLEGSFIKVINWVMGIVGMICVVVIILGGIQYMTSAGDAGKVKKAKDTILYGIIGLIVVALAATIVNFVIANVFTTA